MTPFTLPIPTYQCHKRVQALRIKAVIPNPRGYELHFEDERFCPIEVSNDWYRKHAPSDGVCLGDAAGGYVVWYEPDGYMSWSPPAAFEAGYTLVNDAGGTDCSSLGRSAWLGGPSEVDAALASRDAEIKRLAAQLTRLQIMARNSFHEWNKSGDVYGAMHRLFEEAGGVISLDDPPTLTFGPSTQPPTHLQTCPHCKAVFLADGVTTKE